MPAASPLNALGAVVHGDFKGQTLLEFLQAHPDQMAAPAGVSEELPVELPVAAAQGAAADSGVAAPDGEAEELLVELSVAAAQGAAAYSGVAAQQGMATEQGVAQTQPPAAAGGPGAF